MSDALYRRESATHTVVFDPDEGRAEAKRAVEDVTGVVAADQPAEVDSETAEQIRQRYKELIDGVT